MKHFVLILFTLLLASANPAHAHPRKEAEIDISLNANTGQVEIVHRYRMIDSEDVVQALYDRNLSIYDDEEAQALFGAYVEERFSLRENGKPVDLELVGGEIDDGYVWIYQTANPLPETSLYVLRASPLMDVHPDQVNIVNIRLGATPQTLIFSRSTPFATFRLDGESVY
ncbi:MAG: hypothetical protein CMK09_05885 [Ponticaulis sp.]|nr:hypothetical protein [Ponticaulis sp.]|tara:strand:+ start:51266 stop:51775 length:510 start_codon:yes stop_codon:yes gene_type:complete